MQTFGRVSRHDRHFALSDDLTMIDFLVYIMNTAAAYLFAGSKRLFPRFESGKFWQKRWMDIDNTPPECFEHRRMEHAHKTCEHYELDTCLA
jgi:hypothetical protein